MAFTITSLGVDATAVGTSGDDLLTASDIAGLESLKLNAFQGSDVVQIGDTEDGISLRNSSFGLGGDIDVFSYTESGTDRVNFTASMGDGADEIELSLFDVDGMTVGGQGGADTFDLTISGEGIKLGGGQGMDTFTGFFIGADGGGVSIVGGSEDDTFEFDEVSAYNDGASKGTLWINGQVGEDTIEITDLNADTGSHVTVRGGSENDTFDITLGTGKGGAVDINNGAALGIFGDNGDDIFDIDNGTGKGASSAISVFGGDGDDTMNVDGDYATVSGGAGNDTYEVEDNSGSDITNEQTFVDLFAVDNIIVFDDDFVDVAGAEVKTFVGFDAGDSFVMDDDWDVALDGTGAVAFADNVTYFATGNILGDNSFRVGTGAAATDAIVYIGGAASSVIGSSANDDFILIKDATGLTVDSFEFDPTIEGPDLG